MIQIVITMLPVRSVLTMTAMVITLKVAVELKLIVMIPMRILILG